MTVPLSAALGFATHSGWAAVVGVGGPRTPPRVLVRERVELADPTDPESRQPYHAVEDLPIGDAEKRLSGFAAAAGARAHEAIGQLLERLAGDGYHLVGIGLLESAGRRGNSLAGTLGSHALIHTADGDHFRNAIALGAAKCGLAVSRVRGRDLDAEAAVTLGRSAAALHRSVKELGRDLGPPWAADQRAATLLSWVVLARASPRGNPPRGRDGG